jgi:subtilisin family serine protease
VVKKLLLPDTYLVRLPRGLRVRDAVRRYESFGNVMYASPNYMRYLMETIPDDTQYLKLWGLDNTGQTLTAAGGPGLPGADVDAQLAWDTATGTSSTIVAVIDDGVSINHPDLAGNVFANLGDPLGGGDQDGNGLIDDTNGWDFISNDRNPIGKDTHGTHVAGTIGAVGNNAAGVTGVSWDVSLLPIRIFNDAGASSLAALVDAYVYAGMMGADVANGSFSGPGATQLELDALRFSKDTLFVVAAGNGGFDGIGDNNDTTPSFPCNFQEYNVMCVAATNPVDRLTSFSNFGDDSVHIAAPGESILSTSRHAFPAQHDFNGAPPAGWTLTGTWSFGAGGFVGRGNSLQDSPGGLYATNQITTATLPVNLSGLTDCVLEYIAAFDLEPGSDFVRVQTSPDGATYTTQTSYDGLSSGSGEFDLQALEGDSTAFIRFRLETDVSINHDGIYIDDLAVRCNSTSGSDGGYQHLQGTSMAAPHVAGAAALIFQTQPNANPFSVRRALMDSAETLPLPADVAKIMPGSGRMNVDGFLDQDAVPLGVPTLGGAALGKAYQKKTSVPMSAVRAGAVGYTIWDERMKYNTLARSSLLYNASQSNVTVPAAAGFTHCFRAASREGGTGNESNFTSRKCTAVPVDDKTAKHSSGWRQRSGTGYYLKTYSQSTKRGATLTLPKVVAHQVALVATKCRGCGTVGLFLVGGNGRLGLYKRINLSSNSTKKMQIIPMYKQSGIWQSKLVLKVLTSGKPVKIEGIGVSQV